MRNLLLLATISILFGSCHSMDNAFRQREMERIHQCYNAWEYTVLKDSMTVTVLLFDAKERYDLSFHPNFIIGVTSTNDTIAFIDKEYNDRIKIGSKVFLEPQEWDIDEKEVIKPALIVRKNEQENSLYCIISKVNYCKIIKVFR